MSPHVRRHRIAELVARRGECSVVWLARRLGASDMTIRRDLRALAAAGQVVRTHGGAAAAPRVSFEFQFLRNRRHNESAKRAIARAAAGRVADGQVVMLDSGTTTLALAEELRSRRDLTVVTTSLPIASALQHCEHIRVLLLGGLVQRGAPDLAGPLTEANLEQLRADVAFIGADGIDRNGGVYNASLAVGRMLSKMAAAARRVYVVADSSKFGRTALVRFGRLAEWEALITDRGLSRAAETALKRAGVTVIRADGANGQATADSPTRGSGGRHRPAEESDS